MSGRGRGGEKISFFLPGSERWGLLTLGAVMFSVMEWPVCEGRVGRTGGAVDACEGEWVSGAKGRASGERPRL